MMVVQSDKRICQFNTETGTGVLSSGKGGHPGFYALSKFLGATDIEVPREFIEQCQANQPQSGDIVGSRSGVVVRVA